MRDPHALFCARGGKENIARVKARAQLCSVLPLRGFLGKKCLVGKAVTDKGVCTRHIAIILDGRLTFYCILSLEVLTKRKTAKFGVCNILFEESKVFITFIIKENGPTKKTKPTV